MCCLCLLELETDILICGTKTRNRAIEGDVVAVELLPRNEWKGRASILCENESEEKATEETETEPMPTGMSLMVKYATKYFKYYLWTFFFNCFSFLFPAQSCI